MIAVVGVSKSEKHALELDAMNRIHSTLAKWSTKVGNVSFIFSLNRSRWRHSLRVLLVDGAMNADEGVCVTLAFAFCSR